MSTCLRFLAPLFRSRLLGGAVTPEMRRRTQKSVRQKIRIAEF